MTERTDAMAAPDPLSAGDGSQGYASRPWIVALALVSSAAMLLMGSALQHSLLGLRAGIEGFPLLATGLFMSGYYAGYLVGTSSARRFIYRVGHVRTFAALAALLSAMPLLHGLFVEPWLWIPLRLMSGFCVAGLVTVMESWINGRATNANRGTWLAVYMIVSLMSQAVSQQFLHLGSPAGLGLFVVCALLASLAVVPVSLTCTTPPRIPEARRKLSLRALYRISPLGVAGSFAYGLMSGAFWSLAALMMNDLGLPTEMIANFMTIVILGGMALQWPVGWLSDRFDRRIVLIAAAAAVAVVSALIVFPPTDHRSWLFVVGFALGGVLFPLYSLSVAHTNDRLDKADLIAATSGLLRIYGLGALVAPFVASEVMRLLGPVGLFVHIGAAATALTLFGLSRTRSRAPVRAEEQEKFVAVPETTLAAEGLDPRVDPEEARPADPAHP